MVSTAEPKLAPPGAGLPNMELFIARLLFAWRRNLGNREVFNASFRKERETIGAFVSNCEAERGARRVLIERLRGLEDSSRYWSVWMTLDHLRIVHQQMARVIAALTSNVTPPGKASTANVKPNPLATADVVADFEQSCETLLSTVASASDLNTAARYSHPWFGPLDAAGWHALAPSHMAIHRLQIERILQQLAKG